jgi:hypothetical protein
MEWRHWQWQLLLRAALTIVAKGRWQNLGDAAMAWAVVALQALI